MAFATFGHAKHYLILIQILCCRNHRQRYHKYLQGNNGVRKLRRVWQLRQMEPYLHKHMHNGESNERYNTLLS